MSSRSIVVALTLAGILLLAGGGIWLLAAGVRGNAPAACTAVAGFVLLCVSQAVRMFAAHAQQR